jgi:hypothetical protein
MIHLISTIEYRRVDWIPQFVEHYLSLGIDRLWLTLHFPPSMSRNEIRSVTRKTTRILNSQGIDYLGHLVCPFDAMSLRQHHDMLQTAVNPNDWIVWADIDEFQVYPQKLSKCIAEAERTGATAMSGEFIDRVALGGELKCFDPDSPIWNQFPIGCDVTKRILLGQTNKVVCSQASIRIKHANHDPIRHQPTVSWLPYLAAVHHFKWDSTVVERLLPRLDDAWKERCHWWVQTQRFMDHWSLYKRINLDLLSTIYFPSGKQRETDEKAWLFVSRSREGSLIAGNNYDPTEVSCGQWS